MTLRPDEKAIQSDIEEDERFRSQVKGAAQLATGAAIGAATSGMSSKLAPFFNKFIPIDLALKGINKIAPNVGKFLKKGQEMGLDLKEGLDFAKEKLGIEEKQEPAKENRNIIEQYSPDLFRYVKGYLDQGKSPLEVASLAVIDNRYKNVINKMEKDHKMPWSAIVQTVFGKGEGQAQPQQMQQPQQAQPQQSNKREMIAAAMNKIMQM